MKVPSQLHHEASNRGLALKTNFFIALFLMKRAGKLHVLLLDGNHEDDHLQIALSSTTVAQWLCHNLVMRDSNDIYTLFT